MTMRIGKPETSGETSAGERDAFHVPGVLVYAVNCLPGQSVRFTSTEGTHVVPCDPDERHGIIDPFLPQRKLASWELVWMLLDPAYVSKLTHHFDVVIDGQTYGQAPDQSYEEDDDDGCRGCYS